MIRQESCRLTAVALLILCQVLPNLQCQTTTHDKSKTLKRHLTMELDLSKVRLCSTGTKLTCRQPFQNLGGKCYYFGKEMVTFQQAAERCYTHGSHLAVVRNAHENGQIYQAISSQIDIKPGKGQAWWFGGYWIGGVTVEAGKPWFWTTGEPIGSYKPWCASQPNAPQSQQCIHVNAKPDQPGCWDDMPCAWKRYFVCQL